MGLQSTVIQICPRYHDGTSIIRTIAVDRTWWSVMGKYGRRLWNRYREKREGAYICIARYAATKERAIERKRIGDIMQVAREISGASLKIPTRRFLPRGRRCRTRLTAKGGRALGRYTANTSARCISGDTAAVWIGDKHARGPGGRGETGVWAEVGNRGSMHCGDSIAIGLAAVFQDPRVYLREFIFGYASLERARASAHARQGEVI